METLIGRCHCGAVEFEVRNEEPLADLRRCNCSLCRRKNAIMATASHSEFTVTKGADKLSVYQWNTGIAKHYFCSVCGIYTHHSRRTEPTNYGFNVACIDEIDLHSLTNIKSVDGQSFSIEE